MIYTLHQRFMLGENGRLTRNIDTIVAVPESVSIWALIFPPLWLVKHGLWSAFFAYVMIALFFLGLLFTDFWPVSVALSGLPGLYLWLEGHELRRKKLQDSGFELTDIVEAPSEDVALARLVVGHSETADIGQQQPPEPLVDQSAKPWPVYGSGTA